MLKSALAGITMLSISTMAHASLLASFNYYSLGGQSGPDYNFEDFEILNYDSHPHIRAAVAV